MMISTMNDKELDDIEDLIDEIIINKVEDMKEELDLN